MKNQFLVAILAIPVVATAFVAPRSSASTRNAVAVQLQQASNKNQNEEHQHQQNFLSHAFGVLAVGAVLTFNPLIVQASSFSSSTLQLASEIKTVDMSMPNYGTIAAPTASLDSLTIAPPPDAPTARPIKKKKADDVVARESGGTGVMGAVLPSMNKKGPTGAKPRQLKVKEEEVDVAVAAPVVVKKEAPVVVKKEAFAAPTVVKKDAASVVVSEKAAPVAVREDEPVALTKKQAAKMAKEEAAADAVSDYGNIKIVDMGLPSYSDSTSTGNAKKNPFAIN